MDSHNIPAAMSATRLRCRPNSAVDAAPTRDNSLNNQMQVPTALRSLHKRRFLTADKVHLRARARKTPASRPIGILDAP